MDDETIRYLASYLQVHDNFVRYHPDQGYFQEVDYDILVNNIREFFKELP